MNEQEIQDRIKEVYLGDGLYALFDGWGIRLRAPRENGDHEVFLGPDEWTALMKLVKETPEFT